MKDRIGKFRNITYLYFFRNSFKSSNINKDFISIGGIDLYKSINGGVNWSKINEWWEYYDNPSIYLHADIPDIQFIMDDDGNEFVFVLTDGGLYVSYDGFMNEVLNISESGLGVSQYYSTYTAKYPPIKFMQEVKIKDSKEEVIFQRVYMILNKL